MSFAAQLPVLQVVLPLAAAPICALLRIRHGAWLLATAVSWAAFYVAVRLLLSVLADGVIVYAVGGWVAPWGIELQVDVLNAYLLLIVTTVNAVVITYAGKSVSREIDEWQHPLFYTAWLMCVSGLLGIAITGDAFNIFVFLEISSLGTYILVSCGKDRRALVAAYKYLIMGAVGATFYLVGVGLIYMVTGTLNLYDMAIRLADAPYSLPVLAATGFITMGLALKFAMFPMHLWLPNAYTFAPSAVTALLAATSTKVSLYVLLRFEFLVFQPNLQFHTGGNHSFEFAQLLMPLAVLGFIAASVGAIYQTNIKRVLAFSSVAQVGYMLLGISLLSVTGLTSGIVHLFNHALAKGVLFLAVGCLYYRYGTARISRLHGCGREMPWTMGAFVIGGLSLIGVPLTAGFISKFYLISATLENGGLGVVLAALVLISSLLAIVYIWKFLEVAYFRERPAGAEPVKEAPLALLIPTWAVALANIYFGVETSLSAGLARTAAEQLLGGGL
ncbi:MAG: monovalent cation/H+ antiporter subunit D family protein [Sphingomonadales bacterium]